MESDSIILKRSYDFALQIIKIYKQLSFEKKEFILSKQLLRSGTSIGANVNEAISAESKRDFVHKLGIALKESREVNYWLNLLTDSKYLDIEATKPIINSNIAIGKMLTKIILTTKERHIQKPG